MELYLTKEIIEMIYQYKLNNLEEIIKKSIQVKYNILKMTSSKSDTIFSNNNSIKEYDKDLWESMVEDISC